MNSNNFTKAMQFVGKWEGFYSDDKADPGGKTKYGISDAGDGTIDGLIDIDRDGAGDVLVPDLTWEQALEVYWKHYWIPAGCNERSVEEAVAIFDTAVNCGVGRAVKWWKENPNLKDFINRRVMHYNNVIDRNSELSKFRKGWLNRVVDLRKYCEILAKESVPELSYVTKLKGNNSNNSKT